MAADDLGVGAVDQSVQDIGGKSNIIDIAHGTQDCFGDEIDGGAALTGLKDPYGRDLANELMTGWLGPENGETFVSRYVVSMCFQRIGRYGNPVLEGGFISLECRDFTPPT